MKKFNLLFCTLFFLGAVASAKHNPNATDKGKSNGRVTDNSVTCTVTASAAVTNNVTCNGGNDGSVSVTPSSGTTPYTYMWGDGNTNSGETGLTAGTYSVTVTDNDGCTATAAATITQPSTLTASAGVSSNVTCNGGSDGSVSSTPSNGTPPYSYSWTGGGTNSTETGLAVGTYTVTVTDNCGATATASATITQPSSLSASANTTANVSCNGGSNGSVSSTPSNGTAPYTYSWTGGSTNSTATGLTIGTYTVTVTDNCGGTATASATITQPSALSVSASTTANISCNGESNGSVSSTPSNGTAPYTYSWIGGGTNSTETGLSTGTYIITVTDNCGATATASAIVTQPSTLSVLASVSSNVTCNGGNDGSVSSFPSNGTAPYTYSWTGGGTNSTKTGITAGTYTITVTDNCGATATASATITQPTAISVSVASTYSVICLGSHTTFTTTVSGGNAPYTFSWTPGGSPTSAPLSCYTCQNPVATPLTSTTFTLTVTDHSGCTGTSTVSIIVDNPSVSATSSSNLICPGANTTLNASIDGGTSPFTYAWTPTSWLSCTACSSPTANPTGTIGYNVFVTDANGCSKLSSVTVNVDNMYVSTHLTPPAACIGSQVVLSTSIIGGQHPFTYLWSPGSVTKSKDTIYTPSSSTTYSITVSDSIGCSASTTAVVSPDNFSASLPSRTTICAISATGEGTGGLTPSITGGVAPFTYSWSNGHTSSYLAYAGLTSGIYSVTVTDGDGCTATARDTLTVNPVPTITITSSKNPIQIGWVDTLNVTGGIGYIWSDGSTTTRIIVRPRISTEYSVVGWNSYSCSSGVSTTVIVSRDYWMPSPDTTIPHLKNFPPIYFAGNISVGKDSGASPHQALEVHGNEIIDSTLTARNIVTSKITLRDTLFASVLVTHHLMPFPGDSGIHIGDSSVITGTVYPNIDNQYSSRSQGVALGIRNLITGRWCAAIGTNNNITRPNSIAIGNLNTISGYEAINIGTYLNNNIDGSIMMGGYTSRYHVPAISIIPDNTNQTSGFVGIGTTTPNSYLNIKIPTGSTLNPFSITNSNGDLVIIDASGRIVIGNNNSSNIISNNNYPSNYGLYVENGILTSVVKIALPTDATNWSDYVFGSNYKLKPLTELALFIKENKHLPDVPSADDVQKDGIDVAKMDATLLKKIEELTLYIIQQQQQIKDLQEKVKKISNGK